MRVILSSAHFSNIIGAILVCSSSKRETTRRVNIVKIYNSMCHHEEEKSELRRL